MTIGRSLSAAFLLILVSATHAAATTWLVPGNGSNTCTTGSPNCNTIPQAVTASSAADTISITAASIPVTATVSVTKQLTITGAGVGSTTAAVSGGVTAFQIRANGIVIQDLTIQGGGTGVAFPIASSATQITRVAFSGQTSRGVDVTTAAAVNAVTITDSSFATAGAIGIKLASNSLVTGLSVSGTSFTGNGNAIYGANDGAASKLANLAISNCTFTNNTGTYTLYLEEVHDSTIEDSTFTGGLSQLGILKFYASNATPVSNVGIRRNQFSGFTANALDIEMIGMGLGTPGITIEGNTITKNVGISTVPAAAFLRLHPTQPNGQVDFIDNTITATGTFGAATAVHGIQLRGNGPVSLTGNVIDGGGVGGSGTTPASSGVFIESRAGSTTMPATTVITGSCNRIQNFHNGVSVFSSFAGTYGGLPAGATVSFGSSAIVDNDAAGAINGATPTLDFENNWWGCVAGPGNPGCDAVVGGIDAAPNATSVPACVSCSVNAECDDGLFCTGAETCNVGTSSCVYASDPCAGGDVCGNVCNEVADDCVVANGTPCRPSAGPCDVAESCDGVGTACPADGFEPASTVCRPAAGECDVAELCSGSGAACGADGKQSGGTSCTSDGNPCSLDQCDGASDGCQHPAGNAGASCRAEGGVCDVAETCDGISTSCPADGFAPASTVCRPAAGECDLAELCSGSGAACGADAKQSGGTSCTSDGNPCSLDQCDGASDGCQHPAGNAGASCRAAGGVCDVAETCDGASITCPADGFAPSSTVCRPAADDCDAVESCTGSAAACPIDGSLPDGTSCDDGMSCTIDDVCTAGVCGGNSATCGDGTTQGACGELCDDGNVVSGDGCSATCQPEFVCTPAPLVGCRTAATGKSQLQLKNKTPDTKDQAQWKWSKGAITPKTDYGNPVGTTDYQFCIYAGGSLVSRAFIPAGGLCANNKPCWKENKNGFNYKDKDATPEGVTAVKLKQGTVAGKAQIQVKAKGDLIDMPTLPLAQPVLVQIHNSNGVCWETSHTAPAIKNDAAQYKDKND